MYGSITHPQLLSLTSEMQDVDESTEETGMSVSEVIHIASVIRIFTFCKISSVECSSALLNSKYHQQMDGKLIRVLETPEQRFVTSFKVHFVGHSEMLCMEV